MAEERDREGPGPGQAEAAGVRRDVRADTLDTAGVSYTFRQELGEGWTIRCGPLGASEVGVAPNAFVR